MKGENKFKGKLYRNGFFFSRVGINTTYFADLRRRGGRGWENPFVYDGYYDHLAWTKNNSFTVYKNIYLEGKISVIYLDNNDAALNNIYWFFLCVNVPMTGENILFSGY